jgi:hypothetical protein
MPMPNWCVNKLNVKGKKVDLIKFKEAAKTQSTICRNGLVCETGDLERNLDFNSFLPYPQKFKDDDYLRVNLELQMDIETDPNKKDELKKQWLEIKDGYNNGGYDWCCETWGTKWNACDGSLKETKDALVYKFDTAWAPPKPVLIKMSEMFPELEFTMYYWERGQEYKGKIVMKNTVIISEEESDYHGNKGG